MLTCVFVDNPTICSLAITALSGDQQLYLIGLIRRFPTKCVRGAAQRGAGSV